MILTDAEIYLSEHDRILGDMIEKNGTIRLGPRASYYSALARSIISQQISVKAAAKIFERFSEATGMSAEATVALSDDQARLIGLSGRKLSYLKDLAEHFVNDSAVFNHLDGLSDDDVISELTQVKGIGVWTAQMFLIFTLHRPDVFAPDDRGLQLAIEKHYGIPASRNRLAQLAESWAPYRSTASLHLWKSLDNTP